MRRVVFGRAGLARCHRRHVRQRAPRALRHLAAGPAPYVAHVETHARLHSHRPHRHGSWRGRDTAAFTLADHVLLRPLPFPESDCLVKMWQGETDRPESMRGLQGTNDVAPPNYLDWKAMSSSFSIMGAYAFVSSNLVGGGEPLSWKAPTSPLMR